MAKNIGTGAAATLYRCADCPEGTPANAVWRGQLPEHKAEDKITGKRRKTALCPDHLAARFGMPATPQDRDAAERLAWELLAANDGAFYNRADYAARARARAGKIWTRDVEAIADVIRDRFVQLVVRDIGDRPATVESLQHNGAPISPDDIFNAATRAHVNFTAEQAEPHETLMIREQARTRDVTRPDHASWDEEVLAMLDPFDQLLLVAFAESDEPDGREPTRNDAAAFVSGRCVPGRKITAQLAQAAARYAQAAALVASY